MFVTLSWQKLLRPLRTWSDKSKRTDVPRTTGGLTITISFSATLTFTLGHRIVFMIQYLKFASSSKPGFKLFQVLQPAHSISDSFFNPSLKLHGNVLKFSAKSHKLLKLRVKISRVGISHYFGTNNAIVQGLWFLMSMFSEQIQFGLLKKISEKCQLTFCPK